MLKRGHGTIAYGAAKLIRKYWADPKFADRFFAPTVGVNPDTYELVSDMKNGYPPLRSK